MKTKEVISRLKGLKAIAQDDESLEKLLDELSEAAGIVGDSLDDLINAMGELSDSIDDMYKRYKTPKNKKLFDQTKAAFKVVRGAEKRINSWVKAIFDITRNRH